jgi:hypothetical protein
MNRCLPLFALALGSQALAAEPDSVNMDLEQFLRLYEASKTRPPDPEPAPRDYAISSARYRGEVLLQDNEPVSAQWSARFHVEVLKQKDWVRVPLLPTSVAIQSAKVGGAEASLVLEHGWYWLVTNRRGGFDVDVTFATAVESYVGASGITFELTNSGATEIELAVPSSDALDFTVANARMKRDRTEGGRRIVNATLPATGSLSVQWQREIPDAEKQEARVYAEVQTLVGIGDGVVAATATVNHTILFSGVDELKAKIPDGMTLLDVRGSGIRDWSLEGTTLTIQLNYAAENTYTYSLDMEQVVGEGDVSLNAPLVVPLGVERSKGWVGVEARGNLEIAAAGEATGATPVDVRTLPASILGITGQPVLLGYKYLGASVQIPLQVSQHDDVDVLVTIVDQARGTTMFTADGRRLTSVQYDVRNNRRQFLRVGLPQGATLWSASVAGRAVQPAKASDGKVLIPLVRSSASGGALAAFAVEVVYVEEGTPPNENGTGTFRASLPTVDVPATYVGWTVFAPWDAKVKKSTIDGTLRKVDYLTFPLGASQVTTIDTYTPQMQAGAEAQAAGGGLGEGAAPVQVRLPVEGQALSFEKVLALGEELWVGFEYKGLKD